MARTGTAALLLAIALSVGACGGDDDTASDVTVPPDGTRTTSSTTTEPTTTTEDPVAAVEQAFYDQWDAFVEITSDPDINNPLIDEYFTGEAKQAVLDGVSKLLADGDAFRLPEDPDKFTPRIVHAAVTGDDSAEVFECTVEGLVIFDQATGEIVNDAVTNYERRNVFELIGGRWLVSRTIPIEEGDPGCEDV